jgi:hypothetical protein
MGEIKQYQHLRLQAVQLEMFGLDTLHNGDF